MRAVYYDQFGKRPELRQVPIPKISTHAVLLKVAAAGICRSDWHGWQGHDSDIQLPHVPGHEFSGVIQEVGSEVHRWKVGQRVTTPFVQACGSCAYCNQGDHQVCLNQAQAGFTHWGAFAEYVEVRFADVNLVAVPNWMSMEVAASLGCRFGTAYRAVIMQGRLKVDQSLVVFGCGGVGLSVIRIASKIGARVVAVDVNEDALALAKQCGADRTFLRHEEKVLQAYAREFGGLDLSIDAIGEAGLVHFSLSLLRRRGRHIQVGLFSPQVQWQFNPSRLVAHELELLGSHGLQAHKYGEMLDFIADHDLALDLLINEGCNLEQSIEKLVNMGTDKHRGIDVITHFN